MAPKSVTFRRHDHLVSVLFGDLLSHSYNITFSMFLYLVYVAIECLPLTSIDNGFIRYAPDTTRDYALGTVATYYCNAGYALDITVGSQSRTCTENGMIGEFDGQAPTCVRELIMQEHLY